MAPSTPRLHSDVYPFIYPTKYRGALDDQVVIVTGRKRSFLASGTLEGTPLPAEAEPMADMSRPAGSAGALGHAAAECFAVAGARLVLVHNRTPPASKEHFEALGARDAIALRCDVADLSSCEELVRRVGPEFLPGWSDLPRPLVVLTLLCRYLKRTVGSMC